MRHATSYTYFPGSALEVTLSSIIGGGSTGFLSVQGTAISNHTWISLRTGMSAYFSLCPPESQGLRWVVGEPRAHNRRCGTTWLVLSVEPW